VPACSPQLISHWFAALADGGRSILVGRWFSAAPYDHRSVCPTSGTASAELAIMYNKSYAILGVMECHRCDLMIEL
jgi:hypothetical protein